MVDHRTRLRNVLLWALWIGSGLPCWLWCADRATAARWAIRPTLARTVPSGNLSALSCASPAVCVAVGTSSDTASGRIPLAVQWDGGRWSIQQTPSAPHGAAASSLAAVSCNSPTTCVAVGSFADRSGTRRPLAESWDGRRWSIQPAPGRGGLQGVSCSGRTACLAVGTVGALRWDGTRWAMQERLRKRRLEDVSCTSRTDCIAVGARDINSELYDIQALAEHWNGHRWRVMRTPIETANDELWNVSCASPNACTAVGSSEGFCDSCGPDPLMERWNGRRWSITASPDLADELTGVSCLSSRACSAVGSRYSQALDTDIPLAARWNGRRWSLQHTARPDHATGGRFAAVSCTSTTVCTAVGAFTDRAGRSRIFSERHAGGPWRVHPVPAPSRAARARLTAMSCLWQTACTAIGWTAR